MPDRPVPPAPPRLAPLEPPFAADLQALLDRMSPPGRPKANPAVRGTEGSPVSPPAAPTLLALFRLLARHPPLAERMAAWGGFLLGRRATLPLRDREVVIDRVCARCGCEYEWGVHVAAFAAPAGLDAAQTRAIADPQADDAVLTARDRLLVQLVDELHETARVSDTLWAGLTEHWTPEQLLELLLLAGWYHAISYLCNATRLPLEPWAARWSVPGDAHPTGSALRRTAAAAP